MKRCAFTICAKNYIGLAQILENSIKEVNPSLDFFIFVVDEFKNNKDILPENVIISRNNILKNDYLWNEMSFKYNLTEFCTAIKPMCFEYIFKELGFDKGIYFDPDIYIYSSLNPIYKELETYSIIITPHITQIESKYSGDIPEKNLLASGVYNLGFCALNKSDHSAKFLSWWKNRLIDKCFVNVLDSYYTDQRWIDMIPCFFDSSVLKISHHLGLNMAPWNFSEREVVIENGDLYVSVRGRDKSELYKLIFVHYSGYDYKKLINNEIVQKNILDMKVYQDIEIILDKYKEAIISQLDKFNKFINLKYTYNYFDNGETITDFQRRLYNGLIINQKYNKNPFETKDFDSFYTLLRQRKMFPRTSGIEKYGIETPDVKKRIDKVNKLFLYLYKILGYDKFYLLIRMFKSYSRFETYTFLLGSIKK